HAVLRRAARERAVEGDRDAVDPQAVAEAAAARRAVQVRRVHGDVLQARPGGGGGEGESGAGLGGAAERAARLPGGRPAGAPGARSGGAFQKYGSRLVQVWPL